MQENLWREIWILVAIAVASLLLAEFTGHLFLIAALGFGLYIASHLRSLVQLNQWLVSKREDVQTPVACGARCSTASARSPATPNGARTG